MTHPSTESQEKRNAYTDWLLRQRDEQDTAAEEADEAYRAHMRTIAHKPVIGLVGPNFCEMCAANVRLHDAVPYGEEFQ